MTLRHFLSETAVRNAAQSYDGLTGGFLGDGSVTVQIRYVLEKAN